MNLSCAMGRQQKITDRHCPYAMTHTQAHTKKKTILIKRERYSVNKYKTVTFYPF